MIVIADTSPMNYLVLIDQADVLPKLFGRVLIPRAVYHELQRERTPPAVRAWMNAPPPWLEIRDASIQVSGAPTDLDKGEFEALALAKELKADPLILRSEGGAS